METLKTKTGKEFPCNYLSVITNPKQAHIRISAPLATAAAVFSDPAETAQMWYGEEYLAHYTSLVAIIPENGTIRVVLEKE